MWPSEGILQQKPTNVSSGTSFDGVKAPDHNTTGFLCVSHRPILESTCLSLQMHVVGLILAI